MDTVPPTEFPLTASQRGWARALGVSRKTLREAIQRGDLLATRPGVRDQRILRADVLEWLASRRVEPQADDHLERLRTIRNPT